MDHFRVSRQRGFNAVGTFVALVDISPLEAARDLLNQHAGARAVMGYLVAREQGIVPERREFAQSPAQGTHDAGQLFGVSDLTTVDTVVLAFPDENDTLAYRLQRLVVGKQQATAIEQDGAYLCFAEVCAGYDHGEIYPIRRWF